ncbi:MAG: hypothetical protein AB1758_22040, partial [Candidatus Eremiobacterota bacterium]
GPPPGAGAGAQFHLSCNVTDLKGGADVGLVGSTGLVETLERELILVSGSGPRGAFVYDIYLMNTDGTGLRRVTDSPGGYDRYCELSPDGTKIALNRGGSELWVMNRDGSGQVRVATAPRYIEDVKWHPLGTKISYVDQQVNVSPVCDIYLVNPDGSNPRTLAPNSPLKLVSLTGSIGVGIQFDWHPSGDRLLISDNATSDIREVGVDLTNWTLTWQATLFSGSQLLSPCYSPDGNWVAYSSWNGLYVAPYTYAAGGAGTVGPFNAVPGLPGAPGAPGAQLSWAPDSLHLLPIWDGNGGAWAADYATASILRTGGEFKILTPDVGPGMEWVEPQWIKR